METFKIIKHSTMWSTSSLSQKVEETLNQVRTEGWEVITVSFGVNLWFMPTAYITLKKDLSFV